MNIDTSRSYATEENLMKALERYGMKEASPLIVCNRLGRFTAVFTAGMLTRKNFPLASAATFGFLTID